MESECSRASFRELAVQACVDAADRRIAVARTYRQVLEAIDEVLVQLVGVECYVIAEERGDRFHALHSLAVDPRQNLWAEPVATVPLVLGDGDARSIRILSFRAPKTRLTRVDHELLSIVGRRGGLALEVARVASERPTLRIPRGD